MRDSNSVAKLWHYRLLWAVAIISLNLSLVLVVSALLFRAQARAQVKEASTYLGQVDIGDFDLPVHVDESLDLAMTVPFSDTFKVPIVATVPVSTTILFEDLILVPINTIIPVNTVVNVPIDLPAIGRLSIPIPISTNIPVNLTVNVPISSLVPVQMEIPVDLLVDIPIQSEIPVEAEVPVQLDFPVTIPLDEMGFQQLLALVQEALSLLGQLLGAE